MSPFGVRFQTSSKFSLWGAKTQLAGRLLGALLLALAMALLAVQAWKTWNVAHAIRDRETRAQTLRFELDTAQIVLEGGTPEGLAGKTFAPQDLVHLSKVFTLLNLPWADVFTELERNTPHEIAIVSIEQSDKGSIKMLCESLHLDSLLTYAATLQNGGPFGKLLFSRHETNERDPNKPARLSFELALKQRGAP